jgi:hypothetical protein
MAQQKTSRAVRQHLAATLNALPDAAAQLQVVVELEACLALERGRVERLLKRRESPATGRGDMGHPIDGCPPCSPLTPAGTGTQMSPLSPQCPLECPPKRAIRVTKLPRPTPLVAKCRTAIRAAADPFWRAGARISPCPPSEGRMRTTLAGNTRPCDAGPIGEAR